jgi:hypothetical protein
MSPGGSARIFEPTGTGSRAARLIQGSIFAAECAQ